MFQTKVVEKIKTHILCSITFFRKSCRLWDNVEKYGTARQATDDNIIRRMRFAYWITKATDTHSEYLKHSFSMATMVTRTRLNVTLYLHCLFCSVLYCYDNGTIGCYVQDFGFCPSSNIPKNTNTESTTGDNDPEIGTPSEIHSLVFF